MSAIIAGLAVAAIALTIAFTVLLSSWWVRDRKRRRKRFSERLARREDIERARRQLRLHLTPRAR